MTHSARPSVDLPPPSTEDLVRSENLSTLIRGDIAHTGSIPFSRFMELALYAPELGYYSAHQHKFGAAGDFTTAPEAFPIFGRCLAQTASEIIGRIESADILEAGAGSGKLAATLLNELDLIGKLPATYYILELSADLRERQAATIGKMAPRHLERVRWLERLPEPGFRGFILANELLDAMPVERFKKENGGIKRIDVTFRDGRFAWDVRAASAHIADRVAALELAEPYVSEIGLAAEAWVRSVGERIEIGALILVDYGFPRSEFYHPDRAAGTLMCHYRHRTHVDPLILIGLQDITAHVDFTAVAEAGTDVGLDVLGYTSQAAFLMGAGIDELVRRSDPNDVKAHLALTEQVKKLTLPHEMGELYKVIALGRGLNFKPRGFEIHDRRGRL